MDFLENQVERQAPLFLWGTECIWSLLRSEHRVSVESCVITLGNERLSYLGHWLTASTGPCLSMYVYSTCQLIHEKQEE